MAADITFGQCAVDGVAQCMDADIGVGMSGEALCMGHLNAAQDQLAAFLEGMDVIAQSDAGSRFRSITPSRRIRSSATVSLILSSDP